MVAPPVISRVWRIKKSRSVLASSPSLSVSRVQGFLLCHSPYRLVETSPSRKVEEGSQEGKKGDGKEEGEKEAGTEYILT